MRLVFAAFAGALIPLAGCNPARGLEGIWLITQTTTPETATDFDGSHNFADGDWRPEPVDESPWTEDASLEVSGSGTMVRFVGGPQRGAFVFQGDDVIPGSRVDGRWVFTWDRFTSTTTNQAHEAGYVLSKTTLREATTELDVRVDGSTLTGSTRTEVVVSVDWGETDVWDPEATGVSQSGVPTGALLVTGTGAPVLNGPIVQECSGTLCEVSTVNTSTVSWELQGVHTDLDDEDWESVRDAGWGAGLD